IPGFVFRDNLTRHNAYGIFGVGRAFGNDTIRMYFPESDVRRTVLARGSASVYPADNLFPSVDEFMAVFVGLATGDFTLVRGCPYLSGASDGQAIGADVAALKA